MKQNVFYILILAFILLSFNTYTSQAAELIDISNHWAQDYILNLVEQDIMDTYPDGSFKPDNAITRGEFTRALAKTLNLLPETGNYFKDLNDYPGKNYINTVAKENIVNGYPDETFKPDKPLTRAEVVTILIKALGITEEKEKINLDSFQPYQDISPNHWAKNNIALAYKLDLINDNPDNRFYLNYLVTRAEAAKYLNRLQEISSNTGYITDVYPTSQKVSLNLLEGQRKIYNITDNTLVGRNNRIVDISEILKTDKVFFVADKNENLKYIKAYGMVTQEDLATEVSQITNGILDTEEVKKLSQGDLDILKPKLLDEVKNQLHNQGLNSEEINALMNTNWEELETLSKNRLAEAVAIQTGLPLDITKSIMNGDWEKLKTYAQIELIQQIVQRIINSELVS